MLFYLYLNNFTYVRSQLTRLHLDNFKFRTIFYNDDTRSSAKRAWSYSHYKVKFKFLAKK